VAGGLRILGIATILLGLLAFTILLGVINMLEPPETALYRVTVTYKGETKEYTVRLSYKIAGPDKIVVVNEGPPLDIPPEAIETLEKHLQGEILEIIRLLETPGYELEALPGSTVIAYKYDEQTHTLYDLTLDVKASSTTQGQITLPTETSRPLQVYAEVNSIAWLIKAHILVDYTDTPTTDLEITIEPIKVEGGGLSIERVLIIAAATILPTLLTGLALIKIDNTLKHSIPFENHNG